ncbi:MAG: DUF4917 family protein [Caldisericia bacterium]
MVNDGNFIQKNEENIKTHSNVIGDFFISKNYTPSDTRFCDNNERQRSLISYLHGAFSFLQMHIFQIQKKSFVRKTTPNDLLMDRISKKFSDEGNHPLVVTEGSSIQKLEIIEKNTYLTDSLNRLRSLDTENIFTVGFSFDPRDQHIIDSIIHNRPKEVIIGYHNEINENMKKFMDNMERWNPDSNVRVYKTDWLPCDELTH